MIFVLGGAETGGLLGDVERFDTRTLTSERVFSDLIPRRYHRAIEYRGRIFVFGGFSARSTTQPFEAAVEIFDPAAKTVTRGRPMDPPRAHMAAARLGDKILIAGGSRLTPDGRVTHTNEAQIYDPATDTWSAGVPMPTPREAHAVVAGSMFVVAGGFRGNAARKEVEFFVPQENAWKALPSLERSISAHSAALLDRFLLLFGDYADPSLILAYDLKTRRTSRVRADFKGVRHSAAVVLGQRVYVIGGNTGTDGLVADYVQVFELEK